ncbi:MAG: hypothetical protein JJU15_11525 [Pararhodobacter sp.]|nr:hypothetical protein [Pararhodobacter sp.]
MSWLMKSLLGPGVWGVCFSAVYGLHGLGCARGWSDLTIAPSSVHHFAMLGTWLAGIGACALLVIVLPRGGGMQNQLPRAGAWIGLGAVVFTLFPILVASSC